MTGIGKIIGRRAGKQHLLAKKNNKRKLRLSVMVFTDVSPLSLLWIVLLDCVIYNSYGTRQFC